MNGQNNLARHDMLQSLKSIKLILVVMKEFLSV